MFSFFLERLSSDCTTRLFAGCLARGGSLLSWEADGGGLVLVASIPTLAKGSLESQRRESLSCHFCLKKTPITSIIEGYI